MRPFSRGKNHAWILARNSLLVPEKVLFNHKRVANKWRRRGFICRACLHLSKGTVHKAVCFSMEKQTAFLFEAKFVDQV